MQKQQEAALLAAFQYVLDPDEREYILTITRKCAARQAQKKPLLRLVSRAASTDSDDLRSAFR
jgi:hypothetical protein